MNGKKTNGPRSYVKRRLDADAGTEAEPNTDSNYCYVIFGASEFFKVAASLAALTASTWASGQELNFRKRTP